MDRKLNDLYTLKVIAETLNRSDDLHDMLQLVLEKLLEVTGLEAGWIFLAEAPSRYELAADVHLPPALARDGKAPMCAGVCHCLSQYWAGTLKQAVNIINCKRLADAIRLKSGDTAGITHHATVPLAASGERFGVLNVASPHKQTFTDDELNLLQSVAYQIGTAIKRMKLYEAEKRRAKTFAKLDAAVRAIWEAADRNAFPAHAAKSVARAFDFEHVLFFSAEDGRFVLRSECRDGIVHHTLPPHEPIAIDAGSPGFRDLPFAEGGKPARFYWLPINMGNVCIGGLAIRISPSFADIDEAGLMALAAHLALAIENLELNEKRRQLQLSEERNRLARDLHDAVSQKLFSLSLTAKAAQSFADQQPDLLREALADIQKLSREALAEMRALIWQLRPLPSDQPLSEAIKAYGAKLGLTVLVKSRGERRIPPRHREALWRVMQEALNNVCKHAGVAEARVVIEAGARDIYVEITDAGKGFAVDGAERPGGTLGLSSMRERIEQLNGTLYVKSGPGRGTTIAARVPLGHSGKDA